MSAQEGGEGLKKETLLVRAKMRFADADPISTPIFQTSAFRSGDPYFYTRNTNPNFQEVEDLFNRLDHGAGAVLYASGMGAIDAVLGLLQPGDKLLVHSLIYGCSYRFLSDHAERLKLRIEFLDLSDSKALAKVLDARTKMVFFETPTNPFLRTINIRQIASVAKKKNPACWVVVDNTWATPLFQNPLELGADVAVYSCSKFFSGHSDLILGVAIARDREVVESLRKKRFYSGAVPDPFAAWLLRRSLQTLDVRLQRHVENTRRVLKFLGGHPAVKSICFPDVDGKQLRDYGGMLFFNLADDPEGAKADRFAGALRLFDRGTSLASVGSAVAVPYTGSHLSMTEVEKARIGLDRSLIRLSIGIESGDDLIADINSAIAQAQKKRRSKV